MAKIKHTGQLHDDEKEFLKLFNTLTYSRNAWQVWEDLMTVMACSISNAVDRTPEKFKSREEQYARAIKNLGGVDVPAQLLGIITMALERDPDQDFLGKLYMSLNLGNHWRGQFFTPYDVCKLMSGMTLENIDSQIEKKGYVSVCDPACGAGATLIAAANNMKKSKYNFQKHVLFVGQDIDRVVGMMCYIQLSLLGCAGYICIGNTITNPMTGHALFPHESDGQEYWYMPMFQSDVWQWRRLFNSLGVVEKKVNEKPAIPIAGDQDDQPKGTSELKRNSKDVEGQLDFFSMLGI